MLTVGGDYCRTCGTDRAPHLMIDGRCTSCRQGKTVHRFERIVRVGRYEGALRRLILRFKREWVLEKLLGRLLADAIEAHIDPAEVDYWVPVPSHWRRRLVRGFHPTALLTARAVGRRKARLGSILEMTRFVPQLKGRMTATQRAAAVKGAFRVTHRRDISGRSVCLVDDVTTTGATLAEAKRALREAGARRIYAAVLAKTSAVRA
jgi:ComF family protein